MPTIHLPIPSLSQLNLCGTLTRSKNNDSSTADTSIQQHSSANLDKLQARFEKMTTQARAAYFSKKHLSPELRSAMKNESPMNFLPEEDQVKLLLLMAKHEHTFRLVRKLEGKTLELYINSFPNKDERLDPAHFNEMQAMLQQRGENPARYYAIDIPSALQNNNADGLIHGHTLSAGKNEHGEEIVYTYPEHLAVEKLKRGQGVQSIEMLPIMFAMAAALGKVEEASLEAERPGQDGDVYTVRRNDVIYFAQKGRALMIVNEKNLLRPSHLQPAYNGDGAPVPLSWVCIPPRNKKTEKKDSSFKGDPRKLFESYLEEYNRRPGMQPAFIAKAREYIFGNLGKGRVVMVPLNRIPGQIAMALDDPLIAQSVAENYGINEDFQTPKGRMEIVRQSNPLWRQTLKEESSKVDAKMLELQTTVKNEIDAAINKKSRSHHYYATLAMSEKRPKITFTTREQKLRNLREEFAKVQDNPSVEAYSGFLESVSSLGGLKEVKGHMTELLQERKYSEALAYRMQECDLISQGKYEEVLTYRPEVS